MEERTRFQFDLLATMCGFDGAPIGLEIKSELEAETGQEITIPRLYTNLDKLVNEGLVNKTKRDRRSNEYKLTADGISELRRRRDELNRLAGGNPEQEVSA